MRFTVAERRWLRAASSSSVIIVQLGYMYQVGVGEDAVATAGTKYFSTGPYVNAAVPRKYEDCILSVPTYNRALDRLTLRGRYLPQVGSLEISAGDGEHDYLLDLAIDGSDVSVYIGEPTWAFSSFIRLFTAQSLLASSPSHDVIRITLRDAGLLLNKSIGGTTEVGGTEPSANRFRPINFGFVHQMAPILLESSTSATTYVHSDTGTNTAAIDVRNDGVPVSFTDNADGTFDLAVPPAGNEVITCDVLADADGTGYAYRGSDFIDWLVGDRCGMAGTSGRYAGAGEMYELMGVNDYHLGRHTPEKTNVIEILDEVMNSLNGYWAINRDGQFFYNWMRPSAIAFFVNNGDVDIAREINLDDIFEFKLDHNAPSYNGYQAVGNVNWFSQSTFGSSLTETERNRYTREGYYVPGYYGEDPGTTSYLGPNSYEGGAPALYHLTLTDTQRIKTLISGPDDTTVVDPTVDPTLQLSVEDYLEDWSAVRRSQMLPWLEYLDITGGLDLADLEIGDVVNVTHPRHGLSTGILFQICSVAINPSDRTTALGMCRRRFAGVLDTEGPSYELREDGGYELREDGGREIRG